MGPQAIQPRVLFHLREAAKMVLAKGDPNTNQRQRLCLGEDEQRNERAFGFSRKRGIWSL